MADVRAEKAFLEWGRLLDESCLDDDPPREVEEMTEAGMTWLKKVMRLAFMAGMESARPRNEIAAYEPVSIQEE